MTRPIPPSFHFKSTRIVPKCRCTLRAARVHMPQTLLTCISCFVKPTCDRPLVRNCTVRRFTPLHRVGSHCRLSAETFRLRLGVTVMAANIISGNGYERPEWHSYLKAAVLHSQERLYIFFSGLFPSFVIIFTFQRLLITATQTKTESLS